MHLPVLTTYLTITYLPYPPMTYLFTLPTYLVLINNIFKKINEKVAHLLRTKGYVTWWQKHCDASMKPWVQTRANHVYEFIYGDLCSVCIHGKHTIVGTT